jgi:hypothetical protein
MTVHRFEEQKMSWERIGGLLILSLAMGCAGKERAPEIPPPWTAAQEKPAAPAPQTPAVKAVPDPAPNSAAAVPEPVAVSPAAPPTEPPAIVAAAPVATKPETPAAPPATPVAVKPEEPVAKPEAPVAQPVAPAEKPVVPAAKPVVPAEKPAVKAPAPPAPKKETAAPPAPKPAAATLDLATLEKRLKETSAIGVFTKLTLKNQVDDLINQFRAHYQGKGNTTLAALRQPYDQLVIKVLALLQDGDPSLARAIVESREAIWGILSDPEKFKKL